MKHIITKAIIKEKVEVKVDDEDYNFLEKFNWHISRDGYIVANIPIHRLIMKPSRELFIDHIDGNKLNNQKSNLRFATPSQNQANRRMSKNNISGYKGVHWDNRRKKWKPVISVNGKIIRLGSFENKRDAAIAYNNAASKFSGKYAWLNPL